jgi:hypothetical protein
MEVLLNERHDEMVGCNVIEVARMNKDAVIAQQAECCVIFVG